MRALLEALSQSPVVLDDMMHGAEITSALREIFSTYVKAPNVPAELVSADYSRGNMPTQQSPLGLSQEFSICFTQDVHSSWSV
eukprot:28332-Eustigmatos_ZCMA.PRE.1